MGPRSIVGEALLAAVILAVPAAAQSVAAQPPPSVEEEPPVEIPVPVPIPGPGPMPVSIDSAALYSYGLGYAPNGAIVSSQDSVNGNWNYSYDPLDRLAVAAGRANFSYDYDRNGNRWRQNSLDGLGPSRQFGIDASNNRLSGMAYDALGNLVHDGTHSYTYDAENRLIRVDGGVTAQYAYDAFGRRVRKSTSAGGIEYLFDRSGRPIATRDPATGAWSSREVYAGDRYLATYARGTTYLHHQDWLGSHRLTTLFDGTMTEKCMELPFGDGLDCSQAIGQPATSNPFADYERDRETQLDHTWFRQYSSAQGRWTTPDPFLGSIDTSNPQSFNRYSYVLNDPVGRRDPLGLDFCLYLADDGVTEEERDYDSNEAECKANGGIWSGPVFDHTEPGPHIDPIPIPPWMWGPLPYLPIVGGGGSGPSQSQPAKPAHPPCSGSFHLPTVSEQIALAASDPCRNGIGCMRAADPPHAPPAEARDQPWYHQVAQAGKCIFSQWLPVSITGAGTDTLVAWGCDEIERNPHAEYGRQQEAISNYRDIPTDSPCPYPVPY